jgi:ribosomal protein S13
MARIAGINIPPHKHTEIGLTSIYGIGRTTAQKICVASGIPYNKKIKDLTDGDLEKIRAAIAASVTVVACPCAVNAPAPMHVPARARASRSLVKSDLGVAVH